MERVIKFRFWQTTEKYMLNWIEINVSSLYELLTATDSIPMQFTGLTDKNGKDIYEGDIVKLRTNYLKNAKKEEPKDYGEYIYTVTFFDGMFALALGLPFNNGFVTGGEMEIIGNIYETKL